MKCPNPACKNRKARHWQVIGGRCPKCPAAPKAPAVPPPSVIVPPRPVVMRVPANMRLDSLAAVTPFTGGSSSAVALADHARDTAFTFFDR